MDMEDIKADFERNGVTKDLDEMDYLMIKSRRRRDSPGEVVSDSMQKSIEKIRRILINMKPLSNRKFCVFCKNNREQPSVFNTHVVKNEKGEVTCPILKKYVCPICKATGKDAHTIKYCPYNEGLSVDAIFKTCRNGAGRQRKNSSCSCSD
ncbi:nanos-like protein [Elysia marginata]|uniref:Nanos-like protein n=1 Tax=Elysia marginata TaxID=1093978 RepID=A0AAV4ELT0_9GAST|nr:nanos-like protein [Elysia marginata]